MISRNSWPETRAPELFSASPWKIIGGDSIFQLRLACGFEWTSLLERPRCRACRPGNDNLWCSLSLCSWCASFDHSRGVLSVGLLEAGAGVCSRELSMSSSIDDAYVDTTLSWLLDSRSDRPLFVLFGDFVLLRIVFFLMAVTWCSIVVVELRKKFATRCGIFSGVCGRPHWILFPPADLGAYKWDARCGSSEPSCGLARLAGVCCLILCVRAECALLDSFRAVLVVTIY